MILRVLGIFLVVEFVSQTFGWGFSIATGISVKNAILYLLILYLAAETAILHNRRIELLSVLLPYAMIVLYSIISLFTVAYVLERQSYDPFEATIFLKTGLIDHVLAFLVFFYGVSNKQDALKLVRFLVILFMLGNAVSVIDAFNVPDLGIIHQRADGRVSGPIGESNAYGAFIVTLLPAAIVLAYETRKFGKLLAVGGAFLSVLALFLTASRGAAVGLMAGFLFVSVFLRAYIPLSRIMTSLVMGPVVIGGVLVVMYFAGYLGMLEERFIEESGGSMYEKSSSRSAIWSLALRRMIEDPASFIVGFGWSAYDFMRGLFPKSTHNFYLNRLFNLGIIGLSMYLIMFANILATCRRALENTHEAARSHIGAAILGLASLGACIFFIDLHTPWIFIWSYVGLMMRLCVEIIKEDDVSHVPATSIAAVSAVRKNLSSSY